MPECDYCDASFDDDESLAGHLANEHDWNNLSRIDQKKIEMFHPEKSPDASITTRLSRRLPGTSGGTNRRNFLQLTTASGIGAVLGAGIVTWLNDETPDTETERLNVKTDFGAAGDGDTEDTEAFQEAMDAAAGGGVVYVPPGEYPIRRVETYDDTVVYGEGRSSKIIHAPEHLDDNPATYLFDSENADHIQYRDLWFSGNLDAHDFTGRPGNANSELLDPVGGRNVRIERCFFTEILAGEAIDLDSIDASHNYSIVNNYIDMTAHDRAGEGILSRGHGHLIRGNYVVGSDSTPNHPRAGSRAAIAVDDGSRNNVIIGNVVEDSARAYDIREGPDGPAHTFVGNVTRGTFEDPSNLGGVIQEQNNDIET